MFDKLTDKIFALNDGHPGIIENAYLLLGCSALWLICKATNMLAHERGYTDACEDITVGLDRLQESIEAEKEESDS